LRTATSCFRRSSARLAAADRSAGAGALLPRLLRARLASGPLLLPLLLLLAAVGPLLGRSPGPELLLLLAGGLPRPAPRGELPRGGSARPADVRRGDDSSPGGEPSPPSAPERDMELRAGDEPSSPPRLRPRGCGAGRRGEPALGEFRLSLRGEGGPLVKADFKLLASPNDGAGLILGIDGGTLRDRSFSDLGSDSTLLRTTAGPAAASGPSSSVSSLPGATPAARSVCSRSCRSAFVSAASFLGGDSIPSGTDAKSRVDDRGLRLRGLCEPPLLLREPERDLCVDMRYDL
jgi:hypothetical protein